MIFIFHYGYTIGTVTPFCQAFVDAVKATFSNGASDYRRDSRVWLFDVMDEPKVMQLLAEHFPGSPIRQFIDMAELVSADPSTTRSQKVL